MDKQPKILKEEIVADMKVFKVAKVDLVVVTGGYDEEPEFEVDVAGEKPDPKLPEWSQESGHS